MGFIVEAIWKAFVHLINNEKLLPITGAITNPSNTHNTINYNPKQLENYKLKTPYNYTTTKWAYNMIANILYKIKLQGEKEILLQANIEGDKNARYGLAIVLLCESNDKRIQLLLSILNQPDGKNLFQNYWQILWHTTFRTNTFHIPKNQACKNIEVDCWNCECPYPYGNKELHVTCKMCQLTWKCIN